MSMLTKKSKPKRRSKLRLPNIEKLFCRFKDKRPKPRNNNLLKALNQPSKKNKNKSKLRMKEKDNKLRPRQPKQPKPPD